MVYFSRIAGAALAAALVQTVAVQAADEISAVFDVSLGGNRIMKAEYAATLDASTYAANLTAKSVGVSKMFAKIRLNMSAKGSMSETGLRPTSFAYSRKKNDKRKERNLTFAADGALMTEGEDYAESILQALDGKVMDPLSVLLKLGRSAKPCSGKHRAFDGRDLFELALSGDGKAGGTLTCKVIYTPLAGGDVDDGDTDPTRYEITMAPIGKSQGYMPVLLTGSAKGLGFEARATSVLVNGAPLSY